MKELEAELKELIVSVLMLDDVKPADIESTAPLFREGLGLDSIDALELAKSITKHYGVRIGADDEVNRRVFASVRTLAAFIAENRAQVGAS
jgi:acyl carrier protein